ncbi:MAG: hypothetical protein HUN04_14950 [Desulfobacter sp.]|nr:MAG: hypothetical protein HUN04_14950 [Desulfobacter sp.]
MGISPDKNFRPFIVDVEASGFGSLSYPIEIGVAMDENKRYCSLIHPPPQWTHWDKEAENTHRITREILLRHGKSPPRVSLELNNLLEGLTVYTDGWAVDKPWITRLFAQAGLRPSFTVSPLERILSEPQMDIWHSTKDKIINALDKSRHRASIDAFIIQETFIQTRTLA